MEATDRFSPNQPEETPQTKNYMDNDPEHSHISGIRRRLDPTASPLSHDHKLRKWPLRH